MKTAKGNTYTTLLAVSVKEGTLSVNLPVPMDLGDIDTDKIAAMIPLINDRIVREVKPGSTYEKCLNQIELHRAHLAKAYTELFETYDRMVTPQTRTSSADKARADMFNSIPDMKMLRAMCALHIGEDKASDYILPGEKDKLIADTVAAMRESNGKE